MVILYMLISFVLADECRTYVCNSETSTSGGRSTPCASLEGSTVTIFDKMCSSGYECFISHENTYTGTCEPKIDRSFGQALYPGYTCSGNNIEGECAFHTKVCDPELNVC